MNGVRDMARDEHCMQGDLGPAAERTVNYAHGKEAGERGDPQEANPWVREKKPREHIEWFRGWLAGVYKTR